MFSACSPGFLILMKRRLWMMRGWKGVHGAMTHPGCLENRTPLHGGPALSCKGSCLQQGS